MNWHSQFSEDKFLWERGLVNGKGTFCEIGAFDGNSGSNTLAFEETGWTGLLIEPDPELAEKCRQFRKAKTIPCAVGLPTGQQVIETVPFFRNMADRGKSSLRGPGDRIAVLMLRLDYLLWLYEVPHLDLLSIDTEGTELDVWESLSHSKIRPRIVIAEYWTQPNPPNAGPLLARMAKDNYREIHRTEANLIFEKA